MNGKISQSFELSLKSLELQIFYAPHFNLLKKTISLIFLQFMTGKIFDEKECFGKKSRKIFDWEKSRCNL
jgi:hypothetical protein